MSFIIHCEDQQEVDYYWAKLTADGEEGPCGWCKDKFGLSWQVTASAMERMLQDKDPKKVARVVQAFLPMKKFDLAALERAYAGK